LGELGSGQSGQVFKVKNKRDGIIYALKKVNVSSAHVLISIFSKNKSSKLLGR
jgi:hypothetical protein